MKMEQGEQIHAAVTGATSFLGAALVRELAERGCRVHALIRPGSSNRRALEGLPVHIAELELGQMDRVREVIGEPCSLFFHLGWEGSGSDSRKKTEIQQQNARDGIKALKGARSLGCTRFIFSGSQAEYGSCRTLMKEDQPCLPVSEYGKAKVQVGEEAYRLCRQWREKGEYDMEYIHARIFSIYGPGDHPWSLVNTCLDTFLKGETMKLSACTQQWNFLYIDDLVKGLLALAFCRGRVEGTYNLAAGPEETRPLKEYVEQMYRLCGSRGDYVYGKLPPNAEGYVNLIPDISRIRERTGWKPEISFEEGIRRMTEKKREAASMK